MKKEVFTLYYGRNYAVVSHDGSVFDTLLGTDQEVEIIRNNKGEIVLVFDCEWQSLYIRTKEGWKHIQRRYANQPIPIEYDIIGKKVNVKIINRYGEFHSFILN